MHRRLSVGRPIQMVVTVACKSRAGSRRCHLRGHLDGSFFDVLGYLQQPGTPRWRGVSRLNATRYLQDRAALTSENQNHFNVHKHASPTTRASRNSASQQSHSHTPVADQSAEPSVENRPGRAQSLIPAGVAAHQTTDGIYLEITVLISS